MKGVQEIRRENLRAIIAERFGGVAARAAEALGFQQPGYIYRLLATDPKSAKPIGSNLARKIEEIGGKPEHWLDSPNYRSAMAGTKMIAEDSGLRRVPLIPWGQAANWKEGVDRAPGDPEDWIYTTELAGPRTFALRVKGDSMTSSRGDDSFPDGTIIVLDPDREAVPGDFVAVLQSAESEITFKQLTRDAGRLYLKPLNPQYPTLELAAGAAICGVLIQSTRVHRRQ